MGEKSGFMVIPLLYLLLLGVFATMAFSPTVTFDHRAMVIDGKRRLLISGSTHYPRSTPEMWPELIQKAKDGGLNMIDTYVFWNLHEPVRNKFDFEGRKDLVKFVKTIAEAGLYVILRIGPYVCAEWNYGGFPLWLHFIPGIEFRTDNQPFKEEMQRFTTKIVDMMKQEKLFASQGGPIILSQIENEYGAVAEAYGANAKPYIDWAASMATSLNTGVPWVMCVQGDARDPIIDTCNGFYCDQFTPNSNTKPKFWTENWSGWFVKFGEAVPYRPVEDLAFAVARFFQSGGTFQNYYMYHGGTNFGHTSGGPFISTSYDYDAPIDEYGLVRQPKWGHLKDVHKAIKLYEEALIAADPVTSSLGQNLESTVYKTNSGLCAAFLANVGTDSDANVNFNGNSYQLPAWSVSILPDCKHVALNTARINTMAMIPTFNRQSLTQDVESSNALGSEWSWITEPVGASLGTAFMKPGLLEQITTTADASEYLWYSLSMDYSGSSAFRSVLHVESLGHSLRTFVNKKIVGNGADTKSSPKIVVDIPVTLVPGTNTIDLLSSTVGLANFGAFYDKAPAGITGPVKLKDSSGSEVDLSSKLWTYQIGLKGEAEGLSTGSSASWTTGPTLPKNQPLTWYKMTFNAPVGNDPVAIDFMGMGKGEAWVNGQSIGRYWPTKLAPSTGCTDSCDYRGSYNPNNCLKICEKPSQQMYHVPRSWLKPSGNTLVLFEEAGGDPTQISFATRQVMRICSSIDENHPSPVDTWSTNLIEGKKSGPVLALSCPDADQVISYINFASFGTPIGTCGNFRHGNCSSNRALSIVKKACIGSKSCSIDVSINSFGDPCYGVTKRLAVEASCI